MDLGENFQLASVGSEASKVGLMELCVRCKYIFSTRTSI